MAMSDAEKVLWDELMKKVLVLEDAKKRFDAIPMQLKPDYEGIINMIISEKLQCWAFINVLGNQEINFPTDAQIGALQASVGQLAQIVNVTGNMSDLVTKVTVVLNSWPVSSAG